MNSFAQSVFSESTQITIPTSLFQIGMLPENSGIGWNTNTNIFERTTEGILIKKPGIYKILGTIDCIMSQNDSIELHIFANNVDCSSKSLYSGLEKYRTMIQIMAYVIISEETVINNYVIKLKIKSKLGTSVLLSNTSTSGTQINISK